MKAINLTNKNLLLDFKDSKFSKSNKAVLKKFEKLIINEGDEGIKKISRLLKEKSLPKLKVTNSEFKNSDKQIDEKLKAAILIAHSNIKQYHQKQIPGLSIKPNETTKGIKLWSEFRPIETVGLYIPGGTAPLFSSLMMQAIPALLAGCPNIVVCTPPNKLGNIDPTILWVANMLGIKNVFKVGGSQAIFSMAYGTKTIPKCLKIFGPGNQFVTEAKRMVADQVSIDMPAGPSEVYVVSDDIERADIIASDLLSQLEHSNDAKAVFISKNKELTARVITSINIQKKRT